MTRTQRRRRRPGRERERAQAATRPKPGRAATRPESDWFDDAFPRLPYQRKQPGAKHMLVLVAYDVSDPKRLRQVAEVCEDYGTRVQYSLFECHLDEAGLDDLWLKLLYLIDEKDDRLVAYRLDARSAAKTLTAGKMICSEKVVCYLG